MEILHATCISLDGKGVLIRGPSGSGKSDLALRLIDRGGVLIADDQVAVQAENGDVSASLPGTCKRFAGALEVRGIGILAVPSADTVAVDLIVDLGNAPERLPEPRQAFLDGMPVRMIYLNAFEASTPVKIDAALRYEAAHVAA